MARVKRPLPRRRRRPEEDPPIRRELVVRAERAGVWVGVKVRVAAQGLTDDEVSGLAMFLVDDVTLALHRAPYVSVPLALIKVDGIDEIDR